MRKSIIFFFVLILACLQIAGAAKEQPKPEKYDAAKDINKPRPDASKIAFDTDEGTWMNVDVSPDGTKIIFDILGDIYELPIAGGTAKALTSGPAWDTHARYSPDGKMIAFTSDRGGMENIWLMDADGKNPRYLTQEKDSYVRSAAWTPDGMYLVARKEDAKRAGIPPVELWMYSVYGGTGIKLVSSDEANNSSGPVVSKDGRYVYMAVRHARFNYVPDLSGGLWRIERLDREIDETLPLTGGFGGAVRPALSPDGKKLVYISRQDADTIMVERNLLNGSERVLMKGLTRDEQEGFAQADLWPNYAFTPDGKSLLFSNNGKIVRLDLETLQTTNIPFTAHVEQWVAPRVTFEEHVESGPITAKLIRWPNQSPDGKWIAFDAFGRIWLQEISAGKAVGQPKRLTSDDASLPSREYSPDFSPDGQYIAYVTWSDAEGGHVWKAPLSGGAPVKLTKSPGHFANPSWSPKGDKIAVIQGSGLEFRGHQPEEEQFFEIRWLPSTGGDPQFVTTVNLGDTLKFHPQVFWNKDGTRLYFRDPIPVEKPTDDPKNDLVSVRLDGTDKKHFLRFPAAGDIVPSPDEEWVVFTSRDNVYVTTLPESGTKEPPEIGIKEGSVPVWRLSDEAGGYVGWTDNGKTITWGLGNQFHRLPLASAIQFVQEQRRKAEEEKNKKESDKKDSKDKAKKTESQIEENTRVPKSEVIQMTVTMPRPVPTGSVVLRNARVITMKGDQVLENADIVVTGNKIAAVGPSGSVKAPADAKVIDATGKTIIPGFIDTHAHLHYSAYEIFPETKWQYIANLAYGVTSTYDPSAPSLDVFAQGEMVEAGVMLGPRIYSSGDVLYGGQQTDIWAEVNDQDDATRQVKRMKAYGARMIKVYQQPRREQRIWFAQACRDQHMLLTAEGAGELYTDLSMALDGFTAFEHSLPVKLYKDVITFVAQTGTYYTPTLIVSYGGPWAELYYYQEKNPHDDAKLNKFTPHLFLDPLSRRHPWISLDEYHFPTVGEGVAQVMRAGGNVSLGAHGELQGLGAHWEVWAMAGENSPAGKKEGMTPMEALKASTINSADKIGFAPDLGSIEPGKLADLVVLDANPLDDIHNTNTVHWVMKNGTLFDASNMTEEWPEQKPLPKFFWTSKQ